MKHRKNLETSILDNFVQRKSSLPSFHSLIILMKKPILKP